MMTLMNQPHTAAPVGPAHDPCDFAEGAWVAQFDCDPARPQIAKVREIYPDSPLSGEALLDLVFYAPTGERQGRLSPSCGGPRAYEPACPASRWEPIAAPNFKQLTMERYGWGHLLMRLRQKQDMTEPSQALPTGAMPA